MLDGRDPKSVVIEDYFKQRLELYMASLVPGVEDEEEGDDGYLTQEDLIHLCHEILEKCGVLHVQEFLGKLNQEAEAEAGPEAESRGRKTGAATTKSPGAGPGVPPAAHHRRGAHGGGVEAASLGAGPRREET